MNRKNLMRKIGGFVLAASLLSGTAIMSSTAVLARGGGGHGGGGGGHGGGGGFHGGGGGFHGGGGGFHGFHGNRDFHGDRDHDRFRGGFHSRVFIGPGFGYGYPYDYYGYPYDGSYAFGDSVAADSQGYHDGLKTGSSDARRGQSNDPERSHYFKDAGYGNFPDDYRQGFLRGYNEGFGH